MKVSVVIPTYNRLAFVREAIDSVRAQTFEDWELIVVDDGSDDGTAREIQRYDDPRIRLHRQDNQGVSAARNRGIGLSRFDWIAFLDSDDRWTPRKLERQAKALQAAPHHRAIHCDEIWIRRKKRVNPKKIHEKSGGWIYRRCLHLCLISPSAVLIHRRVFDEIGLFRTDFPVCEDYDFWLRLTSRYPVLFVPEPLVIKYGGHPDQLSRSRWGLDRYRLKALLDILHSARLTPLMRMQTAQAIVLKAEILSKGYANRGKPAEAQRFAEIAQHFAQPIEGSLNRTSDIVDWPLVLSHPVDSGWIIDNVESS